jgi:hypothetical protein
MLTGLSHSRGGAAGNKLKMTLGLPVYVYVSSRSLYLDEPACMGDERNICGEGTPLGLFRMP